MLALGQVEPDREAVQERCWLPSRTPTWHWPSRSTSTARWRGRVGRRGVRRQHGAARAVPGRPLPRRRTTVRHRAGPGCARVARRGPRQRARGPRTGSTPSSPAGWSPRSSRCGPHERGLGRDRAPRRLGGGLREPCTAARRASWLTSLDAIDAPAPDPAARVGRGVAAAGFEVVGRRLEIVGDPKPGPLDTPMLRPRTVLRPRTESVRESRAVPALDARPGLPRRPQGRGLGRHALRAGPGPGPPPARPARLRGPSRGQAPGDPLLRRRGAGPARARPGRAATGVPERRVGDQPPGPGHRRGGGRVRPRLRRQRRLGGAAVCRVGRGRRDRCSRRPTRSSSTPSRAAPDSGAEVLFVGNSRGVAPARPCVPRWRPASPWSSTARAGPTCCRRARSAPRASTTPSSARRTPPQASCSTTTGTTCGATGSCRTG